MLLAAGTINVDLVMRLDGAGDAGADLVARELVLASGGRAGNVAAMAARLGVPTRLFGRVGDDVLGPLALEGPRAAGADVSRVAIGGGRTGVTVALVDDAGDKTMIHAPGANASFSRREGQALAEDVMRAPKGSVLVLDTELPEDALAPAFDAAERGGLRVIVDPTRPERVSDRLLALAHSVTPNATEAAKLTAIDVRSSEEGLDAAERLRARGAETAYVKLADGGCAVAWAGGSAVIRSPRLDVVDKTGAGDAFTAAVAVATLMEREAREAAATAVAAAACVVTGFGGQRSYPDRADVEAMAARLDDVAG